MQTRQKKKQELSIEKEMSPNPIAPRAKGSECFHGAARAHSGGGGGGAVSDAGSEVRHQVA